MIRSAHPACRACGLVFIPLITGLAHAAPSASVTTSAMYQQFSAADSMAVPLVGQLAQASVRVHPPTANYGPSFSEAFARASIGGSIGARAIAGGWDPNYGPPYPCAAEATARSTTPWNIESDSLPAGTPVVMRVQFRYDGVVGFGDYAGGPPGDPYAEVQGSLHANGSEVFAASYRLASDGTTDDNYTEAFSGAWTSADTGPGSYALPGTSITFRTKRLDATRVVDIPTTVGAQVELSLFLRTQGSTSGPYELFSFADFSNSAGYSLAGIDPASSLPLNVQFIAVPSPGAAIGFAAALLTASTRRKRHELPSSRHTPRATETL